MGRHDSTPANGGSDIDGERATAHAPWQDRSAAGRLPLEIDLGPDLSLACPTCGVDLAGTDGFERFRVCPLCHRHFPLPTRERLTLLVDPDSFAETNAALVSVDPLVFRDLLPYPDRLVEARKRSAASAWGDPASVSGPGSGLGEAIVTGIGSIDQRDAVLIVLDHAFLGGSIGLVAGEKVVLAMELAATRRLPLIALCAAGGARTQTGLLSLVQLPKIAAAASRLHRAGIPFVSVLAHPTTGGVYAGLANQADIVLAEPGAQIGFGAAVARGAAADPGTETNTAEILLARGLVDAVVDRARLRSTLGTLLKLFADRGAFRPLPSAPAPAVAARGAAESPSWEAARYVHHPDRPTALDYVRRLVVDWVELHGDRVTDDDPAIVCGLGNIGGVSVAVVAQERGRGEDTILRRNGRVGPAGFRKAIRVMRLAGHLELPILTVIDTPGPARGTDAEAGGIGVALGQALGVLTILPVPMVSVVIGEGGGVGAVALGVGDRSLMLEQAVYSVPAIEGSVAFAGAEAGAASSNLTARDCHRLGLVDILVAEPEPAAHADPDAAARLLGAAIEHAFAELAGIGPRRLLHDRARKVRCLGQTTPEGREAARREVRELQELHSTLTRSLLDWRERWDIRRGGLPRLHFPPRPNLPTLPTLHRPDLAELAGRFASLRAASVEGAGGRASGIGSRGVGAKRSEVQAEGDEEA